jgi:hypothetical protein
VKHKAATNPVIQAYQDWMDNKAYVDARGHYHLLRIKGRPIAPWNGAVRAIFRNVSAFHRAAESYAREAS